MVFDVFGEDVRGFEAVAVLLYGEVAGGDDAAFEQCALFGGEVEAAGAREQAGLFGDGEAAADVFLVAVGGVAVL